MNCNHSDLLTMFLNSPIILLELSPTFETHNLGIIASRLSSIDIPDITHVAHNRLLKYLTRRKYIIYINSTLLIPRSINSGVSDHITYILRDVREY